MQVVETPGYSGENEGAADESPMKLAFHDLPGIYLKLQRSGITNLEQVLGLNDKELDELCGAEVMNLNVVNRLKFKSKVRVLQQDRAAKEPTSIVPVSMKEQQGFERLNVALKTADGLESVFVRYLKQIDGVAATMKSSVDEQVKNISNALKMWRKAKYDQVCSFIFNNCLTSLTHFSLQLSVQKSCYVH